MTVEDLMQIGVIKIAKIHVRHYRSQCRKPSLCHDGLNHVSVNISEAAIDAIVVEGQLLVIEAKQVQDGRVEVGNGDFVLCDKIADFVRHAVVKTLLHAGPGQETSEGGR